MNEDDAKAIARILDGEIIEQDYDCYAVRLRAVDGHVVVIALAAMLIWTDDLAYADKEPAWRTIILA